MKEQKVTVKELNQIETRFIWKVIRNALILGGLYFTTLWASASGTAITMTMCKPIILFIVTYVLTEFTKRYGIDKGAIPPIKGKKGQVRIIPTLLF